MKPPIVGLMARRLEDVNGRPRDLGGVTVQLNWSALQPRGGVGIALEGRGQGSWGELQAAKKTGLPLRLRVYCGRNSPTWVKALAGGPVTVCDPQDPADVYEVPKWWTGQVLTVWSTALMWELARLLDGDPQVREVSTHPATVEYAEPFTRGVANRNVVAATGPNRGKTNAQVHHEAGWTLQADLRALMFPVQSTIDCRWRNLGWRNTRYYLPLNPHVHAAVTSTAPFEYRPATAAPNAYAKVAGEAERNLGTQLVLGNNSWLTPMDRRSEHYPPMYRMMVDSRCGVALQTATLDKIGTAYRQARPGASEGEALRATLDTAFGLVTASDAPSWFVPPATRMRAQAVELPNGWHRHLNPTMCAVYNRAGQANVVNG